MCGCVQSMSVCVWCLYIVHAHVCELCTIHVCVQSQVCARVCGDNVQFPSMYVCGLCVVHVHVHVC